MSNINVKQIGGDHYQNEIQPWDEFGRLNVSWSQGEITKYLCRWPKKGGIQDLYKAMSICEKYHFASKTPGYRPNILPPYPEEFLNQYKGIYNEPFLFDWFCRSTYYILQEKWDEAHTLIINLIQYFEKWPKTENS